MSRRLCGYCCQIVAFLADFKGGSKVFDFWAHLICRLAVAIPAAFSICGGRNIDCALQKLSSHTKHEVNAAVKDPILLTGKACARQSLRHGTWPTLLPGCKHVEDNNSTLQMF